MPTNPVIPPTSLGGGPFQGYSPKQTIDNYKDSEQTRIRKVLRNSWNNQNAVGVINGRQRIVTPFRGAMNLGDFLVRENYSCNVPNPVKSSYGNRSLGMISGTLPQSCDTTGIAGASCNPKFVSDSSDYITYRKQKAMAQTYNDLSFGGDQHNASFVSLMAVRRGF